MNRIRSSRWLETESKRNLELLWLLRKLSPDHKTIAEFQLQNGEMLKNVFKGFVKFCVKPGLYGKELLAIDGSKFGTIARVMEGGYCLIKGNKNVIGEFTLTFLAYNMKRVINILGVANL